MPAVPPSGWGGDILRWSRAGPPFLPCQRSTNRAGPRGGRSRRDRLRAALLLPAAGPRVRTVVQHLARVGADAVDHVPSGHGRLLAARGAYLRRGEETAETRRN